MIGNRPPGEGLAQAAGQLVPVELLTTAIALHHDQAGRLDPLIGGEAHAARGAFAASPDRGGVIKVTGVDDARLAVAALWTAHPAPCCCDHNGLWYPINDSTRYGGSGAVWRGASIVQAARQPASLLDRPARGEVRCMACDRLTGVQSIEVAALDGRLRLELAIATPGCRQEVAAVGDHLEGPACPLELGQQRGAHVVGRNRAVELRRLPLVALDRVACGSQVVADRVGRDLVAAAGRDPIDHAAPRRVDPARQVVDRTPEALDFTGQANDPDGPTEDE